MVNKAQIRQWAMALQLESQFRPLVRRGSLYFMLPKEKRDTVQLFPLPVFLDLNTYAQYAQLSQEILYGTPLGFTSAEELDYWFSTYQRIAQSASFDILMVSDTEINELMVWAFINDIPAYALIWVVYAACWNEHMENN